MKRSELARNERVRGVPRPPQARFEKGDRGDDGGERVQGLPALAMVGLPGAPGTVPGGLVRRGSLLVSLVGSVDWQQVGVALRKLGWAHVPVLLALLLLRQGFNAVPLARFVPGLGLWRGLQNDLTANLVGTLAPPPSDVVVRVSMFRSWGISAVDGSPASRSTAWSSMSSGSRCRSWVSCCSRRGPGRRPGLAVARVAARGRRDGTGLVRVPGRARRRLVGRWAGVVATGSGTVSTPRPGPRRSRGSGPPCRSGWCAACPRRWQP